VATLISGLTLTAPDIRSAKRLVVKIGSALLVDRKTGLKQNWLSALALDVAEAKTRGTDVVLVSSGSIALGRKVLNLGDGVLTLEQSQAAAAVGQIRLARAYEEVLAPHGITTAQILVTLEDTEDRRRYLNSRATMETLLGLGVVPIVNENDTVATDEIRFGDNDRLAAQIAVTAGADQLILLSDVDGFYTANPKEDPTATRFDVVDQITPEIEAMAGDPDKRPVERRDEDQAPRRQDRRRGRLRHGDHGRLDPAPAEGAGRRGDAHLVRPLRRPACRPQALDQRDEAEGRTGAGRGRGDGACARGKACSRRGDESDRQLRARRAGGDPVARRRGSRQGAGALYFGRGPQDRRASVE
jgi:isopentenyl phosphate kinase